MADIAELGFKADTRDLDKASRALDAMSRSGEKAEQSSRKVAGGMKNLAQAAIAATAAAGGLVAVIASQTKEADNFAKTLGISTQSLQQFQAAAKTVGIESEKMGDIFKDLEDKIGEAFQEGTGEGAAALELLGLKAQDLINLPVDEKLEMIGKALGDIESRSGQISILEMLADDGSRLLPLLDDNNAKLQELKQFALEYGIALSSFDNQALVDVAKQMEIISLRVSGAANLFSAELAPAVIAAQEYVIGMLDAFTSENIEAFVQTGIAAIGSLMDIIQSLEFIIRKSAVGWTIIASSATEAMAESAEAVAYLINAVLSPFKVILATIADGWGKITFAMSKITMGDVSDGFHAAAMSLASFSKKTEEFKITADDIRNANDTVNQSLDEQLAALDALAKSPAYSDRFKARLAEIRKEIELRAKAEDKKRESLRGSTAEGKKAVKQLEEEQKAQAKAAAAAERHSEAIKDQIDPLRAIEREWQAAKKLHESGLLTDKELDQYREILNKMATTAGDAGKDAGDQFALGFIDAADLGSALADSLRGSDFSAVGRSIGSSVSSTLSESISVSIGGAAGGFLGALGGGLIGGLAGDLATGIFGGKKEKTGTGVSLSFADGGLAGGESLTSFKKKKALFRGTKRWTTSKGLSESDLFDLDAVADAVLADAETAAQALGGSVALFTGELGGIGDSAQDALAEYGDEIAKGTLGAADQFRIAGESYLQLLTRLGQTAETLETELARTGKDLDEMDDWLTGGIDFRAEFGQAFADQVAEIFNVTADQALPIIKNLSDEFAKDWLSASEAAANSAELVADFFYTLPEVGLSLTSTAEEIRAAYDAATTPEQIAGILAAADAISMFSDSLSDVRSEYASAAAEAFEADRKMITARKAEAQQRISELKYIKSLASSGVSALSGGLGFDQAISSLSGIISTVAAGDSVASSDVSAAIDGLTSISADQYDTQQDFAFAQAVAANKIKELEETAGKQLTVEEMTLETLDKQLEQSFRQQEAVIGALEEMRDLSASAVERQLSAMGVQSDLLSGIISAISSLQITMPQRPAGGGVAAGGGGSTSGGGSIAVSGASAESIVRDAYESVLGLTGSFQNAEKRVDYWVGQLESGKVSSSDFKDVFTEAAFTTQGDLVTNEEFASRLGFASGGFTGMGGRNQVAGVVHGQEYVLNADATAGIGIGALNALNAGASPYDLFDQRSTMQSMIMVKSAVDGLRNEMRSALGNIASNTYQTAATLEGATRGGALATVVEQ